MPLHYRNFEIMGKKKFKELWNVDLKKPHMAIEYDHKRNKHFPRKSFDTIPEAKDWIGKYNKNKRKK